MPKRIKIWSPLWEQQLKTCTLQDLQDQLSDLEHAAFDAGVAPRRVKLEFNREDVHGDDLIVMRGTYQRLETLKEFRERLAKSPATVKSLTEAIEIVKDNGYDVTPTKLKIKRICR